MRAKSLLAAVVVSGMMTLSASAAFVVTETITAGTGALNGFDIHRYFAAFDSTTSPEAIAGANGLQSAKVTLTTLFAPGDFITPSTTNFRFKFTDLDFDGENDADVNGNTISDSVARTNTTTVGTMIRVNPVSSFSVQALSPTGARSDTNSDGTPDTFPTQNYAAVKSFRVEGFSQNPPAGPGFDSSAKTANAGQTGAGALFALAVVPTGKAVRAQGTLSPDKGGVTDFDTGIAIPEPATLGLFSVGAIGLLARRRRKA
jgi:hypothetical protein